MIEIRPLAPDDRPVLTALLAEIHQHTHATPRTGESFASVARDLAEDGYCDTVIAWDGQAPAGLAIFTYLHPTHTAGATMFLKEIFVAATARRQGVGRALMAHLTRLAKSRGCARFDWTTGKANAGAIRFYESLGVGIDPERVYFRIEDDGIDRFLQRASRST